MFNKKVVYEKSSFLGILVLIFCVCFAVVVFIVGLNLGNDPLAILLLAVGCIFGGVYAFNAVRKEEKQQIEAFVKAFNTKCSKYRIYALDSTTKRERAKLIYDELSKQYKLKSEATIEEVFNFCRDAKKAKEKQAKTNEHNNAVAKEMEQCAKLSKYANLTGRDKRIAILNDQIDEYRELLMAPVRAANATKQLGEAYKTKEHNSAIRGGIAAGLGGNALGAATYLASEMENQEIRRSNAEIDKKFSDMADTALKNSTKNNLPIYEAKHALYDQLDKAKLSFVSDISESDIFPNLSFTNESLQISKTGTCTIKVTVSCSKKFTVQNKIAAVVDGTINAKIYDGTTKVGTAYLVLPLEGLKGQTKVTGMCVECADASRPKDYHIEYDAGKLFVIEKL